MSGNWATGIWVSAITPASVMIVEMTMDSRGRSMKTSEIMWPAASVSAASAGPTLSGGSMPWGGLAVTT